MANQDNSKRVWTRPVYCKARKTNGDPCRRRPIKGGTVCATHGGSAPQVREAARRRILMAQDRAAAAVIQLMEDPETPHAVKLAAAKDLLDRGGNARIFELVANTRTEQIVSRIVYELPDDVVDGDVVEDEALPAGDSGDQRRAVDNVVLNGADRIPPHPYYRR